MVAQVAVGAALLGTDEVLELHRIADEEYRRVVPDHVIVALTGVELQRETPRVAPCVGAAALAGDGRKTRQHIRLDARLKQCRLGVLADVLGHLKTAERAASLGMGLPLWNPLPVPVRHLLDEVMILQQDRAVGADGERMLIAGDWNAGVSRRGCVAVVRHDSASVMFAGKS